MEMTHAQIQDHPVGQKLGTLYLAEAVAVYAAAARAAAWAAGTDARCVPVEMYLPLTELHAVKRDMKTAAFAGNCIFCLADYLRDSRFLRTFADGR